LCPQGLFRPLAPPFGTQAGPLPAGLAGGGHAPTAAPVAAKPLNQRSSPNARTARTGFERGVEA